MSSPPEAKTREKLIDVGEIVYEHAFLVVPEEIKAITFQVVVKDQSKTIWWRCFTVSNSVRPQDNKSDIATQPAHKPAA